MSDLVGNPEDRFSQNEAHIVSDDDRRSTAESHVTDQSADSHVTDVSSRNDKSDDSDWNHSRGMLPWER